MPAKIRRKIAQRKGKDYRSRLQKIVVDSGAFQHKGDIPHRAKPVLIAGGTIIVHCDGTMGLGGLAPFFKGGANR